MIASYGQPPTTPIESSKKQVASGDKAANQPQRDVKQATPAVEIAPASESDQKTKQVTEQSDSHSTPDWWLIGVTGLLVIATAGLVHYTRDTARRQLRAYIGIEKAMINQPAGAIQAHVSIKNSGQTPAYNVRVWHKIGVFESEVPTFEISNVADTYPMLGAGVSLDLRADLDLHQDKINQIANGTKAAFAWGEVRYRDVFLKERRNTFRLSITNSHGTWKMRTTQDGNEAD